MAWRKSGSTANDWRDALAPVQQVSVDGLPMMIMLYNTHPLTLQGSVVSVIPAACCVCTLLLRSAQHILHPAAAETDSNTQKGAAPLEAQLD